MTATTAAVRWRGLTHDDVPSWLALLAAAEEVDHTGEHYNEADLHEELDDAAKGPEDWRSAWLDGELVAVASVLDRGYNADFHRMIADGCVHPHWRGHGIGGQSMAWIEARTLELSRGFPDLPSKVHVQAFDSNPAQVRLVEDNGYAAVNWSAVMRVALDDRDPGPELSAAPQLPAGLTLEPYTVALSERTRQAHNAAFTDHWGFVPWDEKLWGQWVDQTKTLAPAGSFVVLDGSGVVVAYVLSYEYAGYQAATGRREAYLGKIGVRREYRGRGIASALLRHALDLYAEQGYDEASLDVDTNNPTGAFGLYERAGFTIEQRHATYERLITPAEKARVPSARSAG